MVGAGALKKDEFVSDDELCRRNQLGVPNIFPNHQSEIVAVHLQKLIGSLLGSFQLLAAIRAKPSLLNGCLIVRTCTAGEDMTPLDLLVMNLGTW